MTPEQMLEKAIRYQDWDMIKEARRQIANKKAQVKTDKPKSAPLTQPVPDAILTESDDPTDEFRMQIRDDSSRSTTRTNPETGEVERSTRREPINLNNVNLFIDDGKEEKDNLRQQGLYNKPKRRQVQSRVNFVDVECEKCHKTFNVNKIHYREYYTCDKCIGKNKGRL